MLQISAASSALARQGSVTWAHVHVFRMLGRRPQPTAAPPHTPSYHAPPPSAPCSQDPTRERLLHAAPPEHAADIAGALPSPHTLREQLAGVDLSEFSRVLVYGSGLAALQAVADLDALGLGGGALQMVMPASEHGGGEAADEAYDALATMAAAIGMKLPEPELVAGGGWVQQLRRLQHSSACPACPAAGCACVRSTWEWGRWVCCGRMPPERCVQQPAKQQTPRMLMRLSLLTQT